MKTAKILSIFSLFVASVFFMSSCTPDPVVVTPEEYGKVLLFHGAPGSAPVDLFIDGAKSTIASLAYGQFSNYVKTLAGTTVHKLQTKNVTGGIIDSVNLKVNKDVGYSYYVYKDNDATGTIRTITTTDALTAPAAGKAKIRFVNLIPDIPNNIALDIEAVATGGSPTNRNDFTNVKFKDSKDFIEIAKGTYDLKVKQTGTVNLVISAPTNVTLVEGKIYTFVAHGFNSKINSDPQTAKISTVNNN